MQRNERSLRSSKRRRRLRAEALEPRRLLAVDTTIFDFDAVGSVNLFGPQAAGELDNEFGQNSDGVDGVIATNNVLGLNNKPPELAPIGSQSVDELNSLTFTATATDDDIPAQAITFSLAGAVPAGATITPSGDFTWTPTEAQGPGIFSFDVVATDDGAAPASGRETITVTVNELNVAPELNPIGNQTIDEGNSLIFSATASDVDAPANVLTYSLAGAVPAGASITTGGAFNWSPNETQGGGTYTFDVVVTDDGPPNLADSETISVTVNDVNLAPVITSDGGGLSASINSAENQTAVTTVTATDPDVPLNTLTFSITGGADQSLFSIVPGSGVLTFNAAPDFENPTDAGANNVYDVQVTVTDNGTPNLFDVQDIAVTVTNVNEVPVITSDGGGAAASVSAEENQTAVTTVTAVDPDLPSQTLTFSITGGADQALFGIVPSTGVLRFNSAPDFDNPSDVGANNVYDVQVTVTDNGAPNLSDIQDIAVTVTNVNEAPVITSNGGGATATIILAENVTAVTTVTHTDEDRPAQTITYSITGGADQALFGIAPTTGDLTFNTPPDFENPSDAGANNVYEVQVTARDNGAPILSDIQDITVTVTDGNEVPMITSNGGGAAASVNVAENQTAITIVTASDADLPAQSLTFSISGGADQALFGITPSTGVLTFNTAPDFENPTDAGTNNVYDVHVTVTDSGAPNLTDVQTIAVTVTNVNDAPVITSDGGGATASVITAENQVVVTTVSATDQELPGQTLTFSITGGADQALFGIVPATGVLTFIAAPDIENPIDAGGNNVYDVQVTVTDNGAPNLTDVQDIAVTVAEVNEAPVITSDGGGAVAAVNAAENQTAVTTVTATDEDLPAQTLTFSISGGADQALFGIVPGTGVLTFNASPDFENPGDAGGNNIYDVQVTVTDNGAPNLTDVQNITVTVTDDNEAPVITSDGGGATATINVAENQAAVTTVTQTDQDLPAQTITHSITGGADQALFGIVPSTGVLTFNAAPDFENPTDSGANNVYDVQITVTDNGAPNLTDVQDIAIAVTDVNEAPVITSDGGAAAAAVNAAENQTAVTTVSATDEDLPAQTLTFSITGGADQALFGIVPGTGVLTFLAAPDFENAGDAGANNIYDVQVTVTDNGAPNLADVQNIVVTVTDVNEAPVITSNGGGGSAAISVTENQTSVTTVTDTDQDLPAQTITYSITGGADQTLFGIHPSTGVLTFIAAPDFENPTDSGANNVYDVQVTATDNGAPNLADTQDIAVTVTNVNDAPVITSNGGGGAAAVNAAENQTGVTTVTASDQDLPPQTLSFTITGGADQALFSIVAGTGVLKFNAAPNFENAADAGANNVYDVQVTVTDNGAPNLADVQDIAVTVTDLNEVPSLSLDDDDSGTTAPDFAALFYKGFGTPVGIADADVNISDPDATGTINSATVTITNIQNPLEETLAATPSGSILAADISYVAATGVLTISKVASIADYEAVLASVTYDNSAASLVLLPSRTVNFVVNDGLSSAVVSSTVSVLDRPLLDLDDDNSADTGDDFATSFVEDFAAINIADTDVDIFAPINITTATFVLTNRPDGAAESLSVSGALPPGITVTNAYDDSDGQLVISGNSPGAIYQSVLQQVQYNNSSNTPDTSDRIVTVVLRDASSLDSFASTTTISVTATNDPPDDADENYNVQSNVGLNVNAANGLLSGATDPEGNTPVVLAAASIGNFTTSAGGSITTFADGSFTYMPEVGDVSIADTFLYTAEDSIGDSSTSTVTFNINAETIWFVDTAAVSNGNGTLTNPFNRLDDLDAGGSSDGLDAANHAIFVYSSDASIPALSMPSDFLLEANQKLIGEGAAGAGLNTLAGFTTQTHSATLPALGGSNAVLASSFDGIRVGSNNTIRGIDIANTGSGTAIVGNNFGTLTLDDISINGSGEVLDLNNGIVDDPNGGDTFASLISTANSGIGIDLNNVGGGFTVSGATTITGGGDGFDIDNIPVGASFDFGSTTIAGGTDRGISIDNGNSATFTFDSLSITNDDGNGLRANNAGTINIAGASNTISTTNGAVVDFTNTTIGNGSGGAVLFNTLSSGSSGGKGIQLNSVTGSLTVTTSTTINASTNVGIDINNSSGTFSFGDLDVNTSNTGLLVNNGGTVNSTSGTISTVSGTAVDVNNATLGVTLTSVSVDSATDGIKLFNTGGSFTVTGDGSTATQGGNDTGGVIQNMSGAGISLSNASNVTLNNMTIGDPTASVADSPDATNSILQNGITASNVTGLTLNNVTIARTGGHGVSGANVTNFTLDDSLILNAGDGLENGLDFAELRGDNFVTDSLFDAFNQTGIAVTNNAGTVDLTLSNTSFQDNNATVGNAGEDAISLSASGSAQIVALVTGTPGGGTQSIFDDLAFQAVHAISDGATSSIDLTIENSRFLESSASDGVIIINPDNGGDGNLTVKDSYFTDDTNGTFAISAHNESTGSLDLTIQGNTTQFAQLLNLDHDHLGSSGPANGTTRAQIGGSAPGERNSVFVGERKTGINIVVTENDPNNNLDLSATIVNNIVTTTNVGPITSASGIQINAIDTSRVNIDLRDNVSNGVPPSSTEGLQLATFNTAEIGIAGLVGAASSYLNSLNTFSLAYSNSFAGTGVFSQGDPDSVVATTRPSPLMAAREGGGASSRLDADLLAPIVAEAIARLAGTGLSAEQVEILESTEVTVAQLPSTILGWTNSQGEVTIDLDAAGWGWFVDTTPSDDLEFGDDGVADASSDAYGKIDLLTVVMHELGHVLDATHAEDADLMAQSLSASIRKVPGPGRDSVDDDLLDLLARDQADRWCAI